MKCREVPEALVEAQLTQRLSLRLRLHLFICLRCRQLQRQWQKIDCHLRLKAQSEVDSSHLVVKILRQLMSEKDS